jgi:hypothetical protein
MFGLGRGVTLALVGWLWADILLGLFVIFLAAASPPVPPTVKTGPAIDPQAVEVKIEVDGSRFLGADQAQLKGEQTHFAGEVARALEAKGEKRAVAIVFAYGSHQDPVLGQKIARLAIDSLAQGGTQAQFSRAVLKPLHDIVPGDQGTSVALELYVYR